MEGDQGMKPQEVEVSTSVLDMSMSLDGFIAGPNETPDNALADDGSEARSQTT
jgi:hypothetical protein